MHRQQQNPHVAHIRRREAKKSGRVRGPEVQLRACLPCADCTSAILTTAAIAYLSMVRVHAIRLTWVKKLNKLLHGLVAGDKPCPTYMLQWRRPRKGATHGLSYMTKATRHGQSTSPDTWVGEGCCCKGACAWGQPCCWRPNSAAQPAYAV
jgi:hypothetical protein